MSRSGYDLLFKLLIVGDSGVGKSCLLMRFTEDNFTTEFTTTLGIDFKIKTVTVDDKKIKLQIWDTAGQERFRSITSSYYKGAMGVLMVYDCTDEKSFQNVRNWMKNLEEHGPNDVEKILIANKVDLESSRVVPTNRAQALADEYNDMKLFEVSAKDSIGVSDAFMHLTKKIKDRKLMLSRQDSSGGKTIRSDDPDTPKDSCC